jgi:hypothetical protein
VNEEKRERGNELNARPVGQRDRNWSGDGGHPVELLRVKDTRN